MKAVTRTFVLIALVGGFAASTSAKEPAKAGHRIAKRIPLPTVSTMKGGKTLALDRRKHRVFVPAKVPPGTPAAGSAPPGTLVVLVVQSP